MFISSCAPSLCKPVFKGDFYLWVCNIWYQSLLIHLKYHHISSNQTLPRQHQNPHPASTVINTNTTEYFQTHNTLTLGPSTKYHKPKKKKKNCAHHNPKSNSHYLSSHLHKFPHPASKKKKPTSSSHHVYNSKEIYRDTKIQRWRSFFMAFLGLRILRI